MTLSLIVIDFLTVPGPVSDLNFLTEFTSIYLTWGAPQEPNGIIISYEVSYITGGALYSINTTDTSTFGFIITSLGPQVAVSGISVSAYTSTGRGEAATIPDQITLGDCESES